MLYQDLIRKKYDVILYSTEKSDYPIAYDIYKKYIYETKVTCNEVINKHDLLQLYSEQLDCIVATRMHSLIVGFTQFIPIIRFY